MACSRSSVRCDTESSEEANWLDLSIDIVGFILDKLVLLPDYIRFSAVCKEWYRIAQDRKRMRQKLCKEQPPMLLIPIEGNKERRNLYSIFEDKMYNCQLPIPYSRRCSGSCYGWWAFAEKDLSITLFNPFRGKTIHLPPIMEIPFYDGYGNHPQPRIWPEHLVRKVVLSCDPCLYPNDYVVAAVHDEINRVAFIRSDEQSWTHPYRKFYWVRDLQFYNGRLYVMNGANELITVGYSSDEDEDAEYEKYGFVARMEYLIRHPDYFSIPHSEWSPVSYLVESLESQLLMVRRIYPWRHEDYDLQATVSFKVYQLTTKNHSGDKEEEELHWVEIHSLGNSALFLGHNNSMCVSATNFPNCKPNCIYYTDAVENELWSDEPYEAIDMGVFDLENGQIEKHYELPPSLRLRHMPSAEWICPTLL